MYFDLALFRTRIYVHTPSTTLATFVIRDQTFHRFFLSFFLSFSFLSFFFPPTSPAFLSCVASNLRPGTIDRQMAASRSFANRARSVSRGRCCRISQRCRKRHFPFVARFLGIFLFFFVETKNSSNAQNTRNVQK